MALTNNKKINTYVDKEKSRNLKPIKCIYHI